MSDPQSHRSPHLHLAGLDPAKLLGQGVGAASPLPELPGYTVMREIGRGGMGVVTLAIQQSLDREVAIKQVAIGVNADPSILERLEREARIMAKLRHPNIVTIHSFERTSEQSATIVMEYVSGGNLREQIDQHPHGAPLDQALVWLKEIAAALSAAHAAGIAHRDIKPENVLIAEDGQARVTDFGLALPMEQPTTRLTHTGSTVGTLDYIAPEVFESAQCDARSDLYSLGVIGYELLTGKTPRGSFAAPHEVRDGIPKTVSQVIMDALRPDPSLRPQTAEAFAAKLNLAPAKNKLASMLTMAAIAALLGLVLAKVVKEPAPASSPETTTPSPVTTMQAPSVDATPTLAMTPAPNPAWRSLLGSNPDMRVVSGQWHVANGQAESNGDIAILALKRSMPPAYEVELQFTRSSGEHSIALFFAANGSVGTVDIDGWDNHLSGVQSLNGVDLRNGPHFSFALENGRRYTLLVQVRPEMIRVYLDGALWQTVAIEIRQLGVVFPWAWEPTPATCSLAIGSYQSPTVFDQVRWRAIGE